MKLRKIKPNQLILPKTNNPALYKILSKIIFYPAVDANIKDTIKKLKKKKKNFQQTQKQKDNCIGIHLLHIAIDFISKSTTVFMHYGI